MYLLIGETRAIPIYLYIYGKIKGNTLKMNKCSLRLQTFQVFAKMCFVKFPYRNDLTI